MKTKLEIILEIKGIIEDTKKCPVCGMIKKCRCYVPPGIINDKAEIAARKIYYSYFEKTNKELCPICQSDDLFMFTLTHFKCRKCKNQFTD